MVENGWCGFYLVCKPLWNGIVRWRRGNRRYVRLDRPPKLSGEAV